jgi:AcrR family transcriptional regulator
MIRERDYQSISVSDVLERANVGRSTFYTHFRDKDDLFASTVQEMLESFQTSARPRLDSTDRIVSFSLPFFEHIQHHSGAGDARPGSRSRAMLHEQFRCILADWIADAISEQATRPYRRDRLAPELLAQYVASTFVLVLNWWIDQRCSIVPAEADKLFRLLVLPALGSSRSAGTEPAGGAPRRK